MAQSDIFESLFGELVTLHLHWKAFRELFGRSEERINMLNAASPIFRPVQEAMLDNVLLFIARLFDLARVCGKETVSLQAAIAELSCAEPDTKLLMDQLANLKTLCDPIIQLRHRKISHNDRSVLSGQHNLQGVSRRRIQDAIDAIDAFFRVLWAKYTDGGEIYFESPEESDLPFWTDRLFKVIEAGLEKLERDRIARRDEFRGRYGVDTPDDFDPPRGSTI